MLMTIILFFLEEHTGGFLSDDEKDTRFIRGLSPPPNGSMPNNPEDFFSIVHDILCHDIPRA